MSDTLTFKFKELFTNELDFLTFLTSYGVKDSPLSTADENFGKYLYKILNRRYYNSDVQYDTPDDFYYSLAETLETIFDKYKRNKSLIAAIVALSDDDLSIIGENLMNASDNPNNKPSSVREQLDYITQQNWSMATTNKMQAYLTAIESMPELQIDNICRECAKHFKSIYVGAKYFYER